MDKCYDIAEGWAAVEIEYESGGRRWYVMPNDEVDSFIAKETEFGNFLSDVDDTTQWAAAEAYSNYLYITDLDLKMPTVPEPPTPDPYLKLIVDELKRREVELGLREAE